MACIPTMQELPGRWSSSGVQWSDQCVLCKQKGKPIVDTRTHAWLCPETRSYVVDLLQGLERWLHLHWYKHCQQVLDVQKEVWSTVHVLIWSMAAATDAVKSEKMPVSDQDAVGVRFTRQAVEASIQLHEYRARHGRKS
uniref:Uncharacterized protein n=1 Tax=Eutreptiella gymnastica TaxID=73025 RepID=A0A7S1N4Y6_9EUGL|mmetsp:Transcript_117542/g.204673  ORF Transcript_117542/g.204673 Transcript_117542/m.204673 type:complete len:139 (+) Transcript_117542:148-564(+)